jgi:thioesterase domain-containing protein
LAFEIACELTRRGREVTRAVLLDPPKTHASIADWLRFLLTISAIHIWPYVIDHLVLSARSAVAAGAAASGDFDLRRPGILPLGRALAHELRALLHKDSLTRRLFRTTNANSRAFQLYQPSIYTGRLTIVRLKQHVRPGETDPSIGWAALARDGASVEFLQGHHLRFLREEHVGGVASWLRTTLAAAETERAAATREAG